MSKPIDILQEAIARGLLGLSSHRRKSPGKPGEVIKKMSDENRKILKNLKSEDVSEAKLGTLGAWAGHIGNYFEEQFKDLKKEFDKRILK
jgi:hypothetical protein